MKIVGLFIVFIIVCIMDIFMGGWILVCFNLILVIYYIGIEFVYSLR